MSLNKLSPQSIDAEQSVLGGLLIDGTNAVTKVADILSAADFYRPQHGDIYTAIRGLYDRREPIDLTTVSEALRTGGHSDLVSLLPALMTFTPTATHVERYAKMVRDKARLRRLIEAAGKISAAAYEEAEDADAAEQRAMSVLLEAVTATTHGVRIYTPDDQAHIIVEMLEAFSRGDNLGIPTGLRNLDAMTGGLQRSELVVLAARPSVGKSALAENIAENVARAGYHVAFFSIEMSKEMLLKRFVARAGSISSRKFITGQTEEEWALVYEIATQRASLPIYVLDAPGATSQMIRSAVERKAMQDGRGVDLVVVDYLQLIANNEPRVKGESKADAIGRITGALKQLARQLGVPVLLLSQLNRDTEDRAAEEPKLSDLRGSGDIEQDADVVLMMWKEPLPTSPGALPEFATRLKVEKQRNGPIGDVLIAFDRPHYRFHDA